MTTKRICYTRPDGGVSVVVPAPRARREGETEVAFLSRVRIKSVPPDATNIHICDAADLPYRGGLRNAWRQAGAAVPHMDMTEARALKMAAIRAERDRRLAALDALSNRARDIGDDAELSRVLAIKQQLRDIPQTVKLDSITGPVQLDAFEPSWPG